MKDKLREKGFTLIELLVVIAILAVLATAVVVVLNPAQLLRQARDSTRISDIAAVNNALALYMADVPSPLLGACPTSGRCTGTVSSTDPFDLTGNCSTITTSTNVTGTGWVDVIFSNISSGAPLSRLPIDPINDVTNFYGYKCNDTLKTYELDANMESAKFLTGGGSDVESDSKDGGNQNTIYEIGNDPGLDL